MTRSASDRVGDGRPESGYCFFFDGHPEASEGVYSPLAYWIEPRGNDVAEHHVMHLHEIHHKVLNDDTSWGSLIHFAARHPGWDARLLPSLVASCRIVHESFASYMSLSLAKTRHDNADQLLDRYPIYRPLARRMSRLVDQLTGRHRREIAATAIARWCMSAPVIDLALAVYPDILRLSQVPSDMRPDHRYRLLSAISSGQLREAASAADAAFEASHGRSLESLSLDETDAELDNAWEAWESAFITTLVAPSARLKGLPAVGQNGHLVDAAALVRAASAGGIAVTLPHEPDDRTLTDIESVQRLLAAAAITLRPRPYRAVIATPGEHVDLDEVLALCAAGPNPHLVVHARRTATLMRTFRFGAGDQAHLEELAPGPVFAIRSLVDGDEDDLVLNTEIVDPRALVVAHEAWSGRGTAAVAVAASCYLDVGWQHDWLPVMRGWPVVVLVDMGLATMLGEGRMLGSTETVHGIYLGLGRADLKALVWHVDGHPHVMLALGDDLATQLIAGQLQDLLGERLTLHDSDWSQWLEVLVAVTSTVIGTEPALRYDGGGE